MTYDDFALKLATDMELDEHLLANRTFEEIGIDSIQLMELDVLIEDLGVLVSEDDLAAAASLKDLYDVFVRTVEPPEAAPR